ncbi:hypothetical protein C2138_01785 [Salinibacterium hongtaonis]|nr:hypothetical protein C2138_01785 [Salinibacterium hongtaonis]
MWFGFGMPIVAILVFRDMANQPCESPVACKLPAFYLGVQPMLKLAVVILAGLGLLCTLTWLFRRR